MMFFYFSSFLQSFSLTIFLLILLNTDRAARSRLEEALAVELGVERLVFTTPLREALLPSL